MKRLILLIAAVAAACQPKPVTTESSASTPPAATSSIAADTPQRLAQLPRTVIDYDRSLLNDNERQVVAKLIEASKQIDEIYWRQVSEDNPALREQLSKQASDSALARAGLDYFIANKGPWDRLKGDEPFIGTEKKPAGAAFYPSDMTKEELEKYVAAHPDKKDQLEGLFTVVRRDGANLASIPYGTYYKDLLDQAATHLREAANISNDGALKRFLMLRADAFKSDNYRESDMAWMDLTGNIEVVIGPYEVYEDNLFNYKASYESFVTVVDKPESGAQSSRARTVQESEPRCKAPAQL